MDEVIEEELKDNECRVSFNCYPDIGKRIKDCVYFVPQKDNPDYCKHDPNMDWICKSSVAQVNAMVRALKARGVKI